MALAGKKLTYALFAIAIVGCALGSLSQTAVNSMLAGICADFGIAESVAQWLTTIYMLVLGITVPAVTFLSRRLSVRGLVLLALGLMLAGSVVATAAPGFAALMVGRVLQAVSAGITMPLLQAIAMTRFPSHRRMTAMGLAGIAMGFAPNVGPSIGGALVGSFGWRSFFVLLAALTVALVVATLLLVGKGEPSDRSARLDAVSLALSTIGFGGLLLAFSNAANIDPASPLVWAPAVVGAAGLAWFLVRQRRLERPLIDLSIFRSRQYRAGFWALNLLFGSYMGITLIVPLYVLNLCGGTAVASGLVFVPATVVALVLNPLAGIMSDRVGVRPVVLCGCAFLVVGSASMAFVDESTPFLLLCAMQTVRAVGVSSLIGPLSSWSLSGLPGAAVMDGSAFSAAVRQACASLGTAIMVLLVTLVGASDVPAALGYQLAFGFSAALALAVGIVGVAFVRGTRPAE